MIWPLMFCVMFQPKKKKKNLLLIYVACTVSTMFVSDIAGLGGGRT